MGLFSYARDGSHTHTGSDGEVHSRFVTKDLCKLPLFISVVACRNIGRKRPRIKQVQKGRYKVTAKQTRMFLHYVSVSSGPRSYKRGNSQ
jgi:hypothetical protein